MNASSLELRHMQLYDSALLVSEAVHRLVVRDNPTQRSIQTIVGIEFLRREIRQISW